MVTILRQNLLNNSVLNIKTIDSTLSGGLSNMVDYVGVYVFEVVDHLY